MNRIFAAVSYGRKRLLSFATWAALIVLFLVSLPFLFDLMNRCIGWIMGLFPRPNELWKECSWCF
jgi:hypothetical protein